MAGTESITYEELWAAAAATADRISGAGRVAVLATPTLGTVVAVVGGLVAGVPVVPLAADSGLAERDHVLADSGAEVLLVEAGGEAPAALPAGVEAVYVDPADRSSTSYPEPEGSTPALIVYTSGTTGPPKGVVLSRRAVAADLDALAEAWEWTADDVLVHGLPLFHVHGLVLGLLGALRTGCRLVHTVRPTPAAYAAAGGSLYFGVPTVWSRVVADAPSATALRGTRLLVSGSAPLPGQVFDALAAVTGAAPVERYGMTESLITLSTRAAGERRRGSVGTPVAGVEARLDDLDDLEDGLGELSVRGATLFDGYLGRPEATAAALAPGGWLRTGDLARTDADGFFRIVGRRAGDLLKVGGYRIGAGEVEDALLCHPAVREAAVVGVPDADLGETIVAYVVAEGVAEETLTSFVATTLSVHKRPRRVVFLDSLPRTALGKVRKDQLREPSS